jgi:hypothetical protein
LTRSRPHAWEWTETILLGTSRGLRGGAWNENDPETTAAFARFHQANFNEALNVSFRVARTVPEPGHALLVATGILVLVASRSGSRARGAAPGQRH